MRLLAIPLAAGLILTTAHANAQFGGALSQPLEPETLEALQKIDPRMRVTIDWLSFRGDSVRDEDLRHLGSVGSIDTLVISGTNLTDACMKYACCLDSLKTLYISSPKLTDAGIANLSGLKNLRSLNIFSPKVTAESLRILAYMPHLEELRLPATVADQHLSQLRHLKGLRTLQILPWDSESIMSTANKLDAHTEIKLTAVPLNAALKSLGDDHNLTIQLDSAALAQAGIDERSTVTLSLQDVTLGKALTRIVMPKGLAWRIGPDGVEVTTIQTLSENRRGLTALHEGRPELQDVLVYW